MPSKIVGLVFAASGVYCKDRVPTLNGVCVCCRDDIGVDEWRYTGMGYNVKIKNDAKLRKAHGAAVLANVARSIPHV